MTDVLSVTIINRIYQRPVCYGLDANGFLKDSMFLRKQIIRNYSSKSKLLCVNYMLLIFCFRLRQSKKPKDEEGQVGGEKLPCYGLGISPGGLRPW